jgi:putative ABC transport system permease protein
MKTGIDILRLDLRYGLRQLGRSRGFAVLAVLALAIGIGANTAIFSLVNAVLLRPLPYPGADRLAIVWSSLGYSNRAPLSMFELFHMRQRMREFDQIGGIWVTNGALPGEGEAEQAKVGVVTTDFLPLLTAKLALGRFFGPEDEARDSVRALIISHGLWERRFGSDPGIVGRSVRFGGGSTVVVGVLPPNFRFIFPGDASVPPNVDVFYPISIRPAEPDGPAFLHVIARLRAGTNLARAQADADTISAQINRLDGRLDYSKFRLYVFGLQADDVREVRGTLLLLAGGVAFVLLIGCANVANLLATRARQRLREITIRAAIGASHARLVRQMLTESLLLASLGAVAALGLGWAAVRAILATRPPSLANFSEVAMDGRVLAFTFAVAVFTSALFGLAPVMSLRRIDLARDLKQSGRSAVGRRQHWTRLLVSAEVALAFVLLLGTGLLMRTFVNVLHVDPGFRAGNVFSFRVSAPAYAMLRQVQQNLAGVTGVQSVAAVSHLPLDDTGNWYDYYWKEGAPPEAQNTEMADNRSILPGYFRAIGASLLRGRDFTESDDAAHVHVAIVDDVLARQLWPDGDALGKRLNISDSPNGPYQFERDWLTVVGVVRHVQYHSLTSVVRPQVYVPFQLAPRPTMSMVIRTAGVAPGLASAARKQVALVNKNMATSPVEPLSAVVDRALAESRFASLLSTLLSAIAVLLACVGTYGALSYSVAQRTGEIGIRMAIGASRWNLIRMVLTDGLAPVLAGLAGGLMLSLAVTPLLAKLLFGVKPGDAVNYTAITLAMLLASAFAAFLPARRAVRIDPIAALRCE